MAAWSRVCSLILGSSIRGRFWRALVIVGLVPAMLVSGHLAMAQQESLIAEARRLLSTEARLQAAIVSKILEQARESMAVLAENPALHKYADDPVGTNMQLEAYRLFEEVTLLHPKGAVLATTNYGFAGRWDANASFRRALEGRTVMSPPLFYPYPDRLVIEFAAPVIEDAQVMAVVIGSMNMDRVWRALDSADIGTTGYMVLLDRHGNVIAHPDKSMLLAKLDGYSLTDGPPSRAISYQPAEGPRFVGHETTVNAAAWHVLALQEESESHAVANASLLQLAVVLPAVLLLTLLAATVLSRAISRPMRLLGSAMQRVSDGDLEQRVDETGLEEIDEVAGSFNVMATALDQRNESLRAEMHERDRAEERIKYQAFHDSLTGLPNRMLLKDRLDTALAQARRSGEELAVIFIDLDRFKLVNDSVGHARGDMLLKGASDRILSLVREGDSLARVGGDEYVLLLPRVSDASAAGEVAERVLAGMREPWALDGREYRITVSLGIAMYPSDGADADTLLRNADTAMYAAKEAGRDGVRRFSAEMDASVQELVRLEQDLRHAQRRDELELHYQPQVDAHTGRVVGLEALLRWDHPDDGLLDAAEFISVAEETGLIWDIGLFVLHEACTQARAWAESGLLDDASIAVNVSAHQFHDVGIVDVVRSALADSGLSPHKLDLEITESTAMRDIEHTARLLAELKTMGVSLSIDDFGTGYSSLSYLKRLPIDSVKIDRSFVEDVASNPDDAAIVAAIIAVATSLHMDIVAEGVETEEQARFLRDLGCPTFQGYLYGRPQAASSVTESLASSVARSSSRPDAGRAIVLPGRAVSAEPSFGR